MHDFKRILAPVDLSEITDAVVDSCIFFGKLFNSEIDLLFVIEHLSPLIYVKNLELLMEPDEEEVLTLAEEKLKEDALQSLNGYSNKIENNGLISRVYIETGDVVDSILDFSEEQKVDLVVIGSHSKGLVDKLILGSVSEKVISKSRKSVLVIKGKPVREIKKILCGYDFLPNSKEALEVAKEVAKKTGATVKIVHGDADEPFAHFKGIYEKVLQKKKDILKQIKEELYREGINTDYEVLKESPERAILDCIEDFNPDLVVLGKRKTSAVKRIFIGTTASKVMKESSVPVMIVRRDIDEE